MTFTRGGCPWLAEGGKLHDAFRGSQLQAALSFLRAHPGQVSPITLTLWGNDLAPLSAKGKRAPKAIASFASRFTRSCGSFGPRRRTLRSSSPARGTRRPIDSSRPGRSTARSTRPSHGPRRGREPVSRTCSRRSTGPGTSAPRRLGSARSLLRSQGRSASHHAGYRAMADAFMAASGYPRKP